VAVWRESGEAVIAGGRAGARTRSARALGHGERYADAALAAARLDEAIAVGARRLQMRLDWLETDSRRWTYGLAALALAGVAAALWLGLAVRAAAVEAEAGRRALAAALESKARFTRGLSHDLKNPLGAIDGHAALLEAEIHGPLNAAQRGAIARVRGAVRALLALVDDLLALAHAETGELAVRPVATDVHALVRDLVEEHRASVNGAGLTLETCVPAQARECATDAARLRQVLGNLLANATKYTPSGGRVTVEVCDGTDCVRVEVRDTGPGIPPDRREFVFQEFTRLPGTAAPGAGLGLAISRHIARLLGGDLWVDERPEPGACFVLEVPASVRTGARPPPGARAAQPADGRGAGRVGGVAS
jgi:signal transduction histidine kinase